MLGVVFFFRQVSIFLTSFYLQNILNRLKDILVQSLNLKNISPVINVRKYTGVYILPFRQK